MKHDFGFREQQVKPYTFNPQPFLADKRTAMQGYVTSEPYAIETQGGFKPKIFLLADQGFGSYSTLIETRRDLVEKKPDLVQRFVDASAIGWTNYLYGDNAAANARIKRDNPEMTDALIAYSIAKMKEYGIVDSGDALKLGIGAMTDARMKSFFDKMVASGVVKGGIDYKKAYTLQFVNKGVGLRPAAEELTADDAPTAPMAHARHADPPVVSLRGVGKVFGTGTLALDGLDLDVRERRVPVAARPVGLRQVDGAAHHRGLERAVARHRHLAGRRRGRRPRSIGFVFQEPTLMPWATVFGNVFLPLKLAGTDQGRGRAARRWRRCRASASPISPTPIRANCPAACGCGCRSRARSSPRRACC